MQRPESPYRRDLLLTRLDALLRAYGDAAHDPVVPPTACTIHKKPSTARSFSHNYTGKECNTWWLKVLRTSTACQPGLSSWHVHTARQGCYLQVELNTISAAAGSLSTLTGKMHEYLLRRHPYACEAAPGQLPQKQALKRFARGLGEAHLAFCTLHSIECDQAALVMVVQEAEWNVSDQWLLQMQVWNAYGIHVIRKTLAEIAQEGVLEPSGHVRCAQPFGCAAAHSEVHSSVQSADATRRGSDTDVVAEC
jgi:hypothetical protein